MVKGIIKMKMTDKDWLEKITIAYKAYPYPSKEIERFIRWMYEQYGIVQPPTVDKKND
jgi:hypothetical protein